MPDQLIMGVRIILLGILAQVMIRNDQNKIDFVEIPSRMMPIVNFDHKKLLTQSNFVEEIKSDSRLDEYNMEE